jgi:hypothetical protein
MKYAVDVNSSAMIYIPNFIKIGSSIQKLIGGYTDTQMHRQHDGRISLSIVFQNKESRLKIRAGLSDRLAVCVPVYLPYRY